MSFRSDSKNDFELYFIILIDKIDMKYRFIFNETDNNLNNNYQLLVAFMHEDLTNLLGYLKFGHEYSPVIDRSAFFACLSFVGVIFAVMIIWRSWKCNKKAGKQIHVSNQYIS